MDYLKDLLHIYEESSYVGAGKFGTPVIYNIVRNNKSSGCLMTKRTSSKENVHKLFWSTDEYALENDYVERLFSLVKKSNSVITNRDVSDKPLYYMSCFYINGTLDQTPISVRVENVYKPDNHRNSLFIALEELKKYRGRKNIT